MQYKSKAYAIIDNAFVYGVGSLFLRRQSEQTVKNVNVLALAGLADALVMHDFIMIDSRGWDFATRYWPESWTAELSNYVEIEEFELPSTNNVVDCLLKSDTAKLLCQALNWIDNTVTSENSVNLRQSYLSYTGHEIGYWKSESAIIQRLHDGIEQDSWLSSCEFNLRTAEHVSTLQCMVRAIQYSEFASTRGLTYYSHEFRGRIINAICSIGTNQQYKKFWTGLVKKLQEQVILENSENWVWKTDEFEKSFEVWEKFDSPIFLSMALRECQHINDLISRILDLREKAAPLRRVFREYIRSIEMGDNESRNELLLELDEISKSLAPLGVSIGYQPSEKRNLKSLAIARDLYDNCVLPYTFYDDINRLLGWCSVLPDKYPSAVKPNLDYFDSLSD